MSRRRGEDEHGAGSARDDESRRAGERGRAAKPLRGDESRRADEPGRAGERHGAGERRRDEGMRIRREVLGDEHVDRALASTTPFSAPFQDFITRTAWGDVWARPGLDRRTRSCITLAILVALRAEDELAMHVRAALRNGLTAAEIREVILHAAVYAGIPAANTAMGIAARVLRDEGVPDAMSGPGEDGAR